MKRFYFSQRTPDRADLCRRLRTLPRIVPQSSGLQLVLADPGYFGKTVLPFVAVLK
jgi:hypothetical protein